MGQESRLNFSSSSFSDSSPELHQVVGKGCRSLKTQPGKDMISKLILVVVGKNQFLVDCKSDPVPYLSLAGRHPQLLAIRS